MELWGDEGLTKAWNRQNVKSLNREARPLWIERVEHRWQLRVGESRPLKTENPQTFNNFDPFNLFNVRVHISRFFVITSSVPRVLTM